jgi:hypothetical protein
MRLFPHPPCPLSPRAGERELSVIDALIRREEDGSYRCLRTTRLRTLHAIRLRTLHARHPRTLRARRPRTLHTHPASETPAHPGCESPLLKDPVLLTRDLAQGARQRLELLQQQPDFHRRILILAHPPDQIALGMRAKQAVGFIEHLVE